MVVIGFIVVVSCLLALVALAVGLIVIFVIFNSGQRDVVSAAREGWINRRSEQDQESE